MDEFPLTAAEARNLDPARYDFIWNADYSRCRAVKLAWYDDASYAAYQGDGCEPDDYGD